MLPNDSLPPAPSGEPEYQLADADGLFLTSLALSLAEGWKQNRPDACAERLRSIASRLASLSTERARMERERDEQKERADKNFDAADKLLKQLKRVNAESMEWGAERARLGCEVSRLTSELDRVRADRDAHKKNYLVVKDWHAEAVSDYDDVREALAKVMKAHACHEGVACAACLTAGAALGVTPDATTRREG